VNTVWYQVRLGLNRKVSILICYIRLGLQGPPFGFDIMYLALADRNMQVRFGLKVAWES
jgi:hypothetical protein